MGFTRDKEYDITQGEPGSKILYFLPTRTEKQKRLPLKPKPRLKMLILNAILVILL